MSHFDKFIDDLTKREKSKKKITPTEKEAEYQEARLRRVKMFQERWQNSIKWIPGRKK